jgi:valyl-tRNA synthetase
VISRQRYFATPIPVWECHECNKIVPATIDQCYVDPLNDDPPVAYCPECGGKLVGSKEVFDTWMDSSISALYNSYWYRDDTMFEKLYPMTVRTQAHDIIRTWAFYSLLRTVLLTEENPWQDIFVDGHILAPDGRSMHASWGNTIDPLEILEEYGSDPMRYFSASRGLGEDSAFSWKEITHSQRFINKIYNIGRFLENADAKGEVTMIDRWIASELALSIEKVEDAINKYQFSGALKEAERFIWHVFADNYLEMIKYRLYNDTLPADYVKGLYAAALKLIAPILVHVTEEVYSHLIGDGSIHTSEWPQVDLDEEALNKGRMAKDIISEIRRWKSDAGLALNKELSSVTIYTEEDLDGLVDDIKGAMNIGEVTISAGQPDVKEVIVSVTPDFSLIGPTFGKDTKKVSTLLTDPDVASRLIEEGALEMEGFTLKKEYIAKVERAFEQKGKKVELIEHPSFIIEINE